MDIENAGEVTQMLAAAAGGDRAAIDKIYVIVYPELRSLAHKRVRASNNSEVLDTTSLAHESYLRFVKAGKIAECLGVTGRTVRRDLQKVRMLLLDPRE